MVESYDPVAVVAVLLLAEVCGIWLAVDAIMRPRSSQGAIAWSVSLVAMPFIAIPLYLIFGRTRFKGYTEALREAECEVGERISSWRTQMAALAGEVGEEIDSVAAVVERLAELPFTYGNRAQLLVDGEATYVSMHDAIAAATSYVLVQFYIVRDDEVGRRLRDALVEKARTGVQVCFLYDEIGSWSLPGAYLDVMRRASVQVSGFRTTRGRRNRLQVNFRNHRKLLIVDGRLGFIGGLNLGEEYLVYRDTHLRIEGPAAQSIQISFLKDWYWAKRHLPNVSLDAPLAKADGQVAAVVNTGPADRHYDCSVLFASLINAARSRLWISSPYFVPDDVAVRALQAAALRGVDVRILLPAKADHRFVELASYTYCASMLDCGVQLYRYQGRFMHQKVVLVDHGLAGVGTVNLDNRSLYLNFEATALVADRGFASSVEAMLRDDLGQCQPVRRDQFDQRSLAFRAAARVARLASPLL